MRAIAHFQECQHGLTGPCCGVAPQTWRLYRRCSQRAARRGPPFCVVPPVLRARTRIKPRKGRLMSITPLMPVYPRCDVRPVRGEGCYLIGERGERYLDFASGIAVNLLGHGHPRLVKAIADQAATLMHVSNLYGMPLGEKFAQKLVDTTFADTVFFTNSGAEAVECRDQDRAPLPLCQWPGAPAQDHQLRQCVSRADAGDDLGHQPAQDARRVRTVAARLCRGAVQTIWRPRWRRSTTIPPVSCWSRCRAKAA